MLPELAVGLEEDFQGGGRLREPVLEIGGDLVQKGVAQFEAVAWEGLG